MNTDDTDYNEMLEDDIEAGNVNLQSVEGNDPSKAMCSTKRGNSVDVDVEVYGPIPPVYDPVKEFVNLAQEGKAKLTYSVEHNGRRKRLTFSESETQQYVEANTLEARTQVVGKKLREYTFAQAHEAEKRFKECKYDLQKLSPEDEAVLWETQKLYTKKGKIVYREGWGFDDANGGFPSTATGSQGYPEFLPYGLGPFGQQLYLAYHWDMLAKCWYAWHHDPVAHQGIQIIAYFLLGRGIEIVCEDESVQKVVNDFWSDQRMQERLLQLVIDLSRDGELFIRKIKDRGGYMRLRALDPTTIWEIMTDAEDIEKVYYYHQQYMTRTQLYSLPGNKPSEMYITRDLKPTEVMHVKVNAGSNEVRGRSDLFPVLGRLRLLRDYITAEVQKAQAQAQIQWDYTVKGGAADIARVQNTATPPAPGTVGNAFYHNEAVKVEAVKASDHSPVGNGSVYEALINLIAVGLGIAKDYLGVTSRGSRSTGLIATEPSSKFFETRQKLIREVVDSILQDVIDWAQQSGRLKKGVNTEFRSVFPAIATSDKKLTLELLSQGVAMGWWSNEFAASAAALNLEFKGFDAADERKIIAQELKTGYNTWKNYQQVPVGLPVQETATPSEIPGNSEPIPADTANKANPLGDSGKSQIKKQQGPNLNDTKRELGDSE